MTHQSTAREIAALSGRRPIPDFRFMPVDGVVWWLERGSGRTVPSVWEVLTRPLPFLWLFDRMLLRGVVLMARRKVRAVEGLERVLAPEPFILALNHSTRREALLVPALLIFHRGGRLIHFWSDWMFRLMPGIGLMLGRAGTIPVTTKPARYRVLNLFRRFFVHPLPALDRARALASPPATPSARFRKAPSTTIPVGFWPAASAPPACRWRPARPSCRPPSASPMSRPARPRRRKRSWRSPSASR